ncbi:ATP synthase F0 subunit B [Clostridiaceae bacterium Marseille-Q4145]|nr:ATP synthase F0 subunit B [Clostridiaceae bacterium Marseille-Q4145]
MLRLDFNLVFTIVNLLIWYVIIRKFLFKPINDIITKREDAINARYAEAQKLQDDAKAEKEKSAQFQAQIEREKAKIMADAQADARVEYDQIVSDAHKKAGQIIDSSKKEAALQKEKVMNKAEQEIRGMILEAAVKSMQSENNDGALYDQFLTKAGETTHEES